MRFNAITFYSVQELNANWIRQALTQARNKTIEKKQPKRGKVSRPMLLEFD